MALTSHAQLNGTLQVVTVGRQYGMGETESLPPDHLTGSLPKRRVPGSRRRIAVFLTAFLIVLLGLAGLLYWKVVRVQAAIAAHSSEPPPIEVVASEVTSTTLPRSLNSIGTLRAVRAVDIAPEVAGRIVSVNFEAGQRVFGGQLLLQLDDRIEQAALKAATAKADYAREQLDRAKTLALSQAQSRQTLDQRQSEFDQAVAVVEQLQTQIAQKAVRAPFDGFLGLRSVNLGENIDTGTKIVSLTALDRLYVNFAVPQQDLSKLRNGGRLSVYSDAFPGEEFPAAINAIETSIDVNTRNVTAQATLQNPGARLRPGLFVAVDVALPQRDDVILVPTTAVQASSSGDTAFLIKEGKVEIVSVKTGERVDGRVVIESGLSPGDTVITAGQVRLYPGARVAVAAVKD